MSELSEKITKQLDKIHHQLGLYKKEGKKLFVSSSFQTHSVPLLHLLTQKIPDIPVYFLNTGYHFPETHTYVRNLSVRLNLNIKYLTSPTPKAQQKDLNGQLLFCSNPHRCCDINKVEPLEPILQSYDIWITGVRRDQNANRSTMDFEAQGPFGTTRFHPMIDWNARMIHEYRQVYNLPPHPLESQGYLSIGCEPCTEKYISDDRTGRWIGQAKNECGLHTDLIQ